jgi:hypothetical protein
MNAATLPFLALPLVALACSSSSAAPSGAGAGGGSGGGQPGVAFAAYCSGTLLTEQKILHPAGAGTWLGNGMKVPAATTFLISAEYGLWGGFVVDGTAAPVRLEADFAKGLVKGTDFTAGCATDSSPSSPKIKRVLLARTTFYPKMDLTGAACALDPGTELTNLSFMSLGGAATVSADAIHAQCKLSVAYSNDMAYGDLEAK